MGAELGRAWLCAQAMESLSPRLLARGIGSLPPLERAGTAEMLPLKECVLLLKYIEADDASLLLGGMHPKRAAEVAAAMADADYRKAAHGAEPRRAAG